MKWKKKTYKAHDTRIKRKFLWLPIHLNNEVRWLQFATIRQSYFMGIWTSDRWID